MTEVGENINSDDRRHWALAVIATVMLAIVVAACGGGSKTTSAGTTATGTGGTAAAQQVVTAALGPVKLEAPGPAFKANRNVAGRTIYIVPNTTVSTFWANVIRGLKQAAALFHVNVVAISADGTNAGGSRGVAEATAQKASAIVIGSLESQALAAPIKAATAAHIPVIMMYDQEQGPVSARQQALGIYGNVGVCDSCEGRLLAAETVVAMKGHVKAVSISSPEIPPAENQASGFVSGVKEFCSSCSARIVHVPLADWSTQLAPATTSIVADPSVNVINPVFTDMYSFVLPALASAGAASRVKVVGQGVDTPKVLQEIKSGQTLAADSGPDGYAGWLAFDQVLRNWSGQPPATKSFQPYRLFTSTNVGQLNLADTSSDSWFGADWPTFFKKLWGLS